MKKDFGRFLILVCGFGLFMLMGAAFEGLMSFGGLCVFLQTASVAKGLDLRYYALGRCISCGVCLAGAVCPWSLPGILGIPILKKWVAFFRKGVYNGRNKERRRTLCFSERK